MKSQKNCSIIDCNKIVYCKDLCTLHYARKKRYGDPNSPSLHSVRQEKCIVDECDNKWFSKGYCEKHYQRWRKYGDPNIMLRNENGKGTIDDSGYKRFKINGKVISEHKIIMETYLNRELLPEENIHHKNGNRLDNRIENLELWNTKQPSGQKIEDKIKWAKEILMQYDPTSLKD